MKKRALILTEEFLKRTGYEPDWVAMMWERYDGKPDAFEEFLRQGN